MSDMNKKNINYGALNRFYKDLKSHDLSGLATEQYVDDAIVDVKPITNVSALPDAEANKDKVLRLNSNNKLYISYGSFNEQQIDKGYLVSEQTNYYYKGDFTIQCSDGILKLPLWTDNNDYKYFTNIYPDNITGNTINATTEDALFDGLEISFDEEDNPHTDFTLSQAESIVNTQVSSGLQCNVVLADVLSGWQRVVTEDELNGIGDVFQALEARIYALEHPTTTE